MRPFLTFAIMSSALLAQKPLIEGNPNSEVRVVVYEDLQCSDCAVFRRMLDEKLLPRFAKTVAFEHRDFPLEKHAWARRAAIAARFFQEHKAETGVEYRRQVLAGMASITPETFEPHLAAFAKTQRIDPAKALAAQRDARLANLVERDYQEGIARGIARTPTVLVNGEAFIETFSADEIAASIERNLKELGKQ